MSTHSKTGGSRASDEDGRTAVRVGTYSLYTVLTRTQPYKLGPVTGRMGQLMTRDSCSSATPFTAVGSWFRSYTSALPAIYGTDNIPYEYIYRFPTRQEALRFRPRLQRRCRPGRCLGILEREH